MQGGKNRTQASTLDNHPLDRVPFSASQSLVGLDLIHVLVSCLLKLMDCVVELELACWRCTHHFQELHERRHCDAIDDHCRRYNNDRHQEDNRWLSTAVVENDIDGLLIP